jgi:threonine dehydratase
LISLSEIQRARERLGDAVRPTPLVSLDVDAPCEILLKLECLQPIGSFKLRGGLSAVRAATRDELAHGVVTASAGNMAQGVAWAAREAGVPATIIAPDTAPRTKLDAVERLGGRVIRVPHEVWWQTMLDRGHPDAQGLFIHPVADQAVIAGNGTIGLELCEELASFDTVVIPWGSRVPSKRSGRMCVSSRPSPRPRRRSAHLSRPATRSRSTTSRRSSTAPGGGRCCPACGSTRRSWSTKRWRYR